MVINTVYNPYLNKNIEIKAPDIKTLEAYIRISREMQSECSSDSEAWHNLQSLIDAYEETLDIQRRCNNDL